MSILNVFVDKELVNKLSEIGQFQKNNPHDKKITLERITTAYQDCKKRTDAKCGR